MLLERGSPRFPIKCLDKGNTGQQLAKGAVGIGSWESGSLTPNLSPLALQPQRNQSSQSVSTLQKPGFKKKKK